MEVSLRELAQEIEEQQDQKAEHGGMVGGQVNSGNPCGRCFDSGLRAFRILPKLFKGEKILRYVMSLEDAVSFITGKIQSHGKLRMGDLPAAVEFDQHRLARGSACIP